jgi:hypothetical protein
MVVTWAVAAGYPPDYGPFVPGREPARVRLETCPLLEEQGPAVMMGRRVMVYGRTLSSGSTYRVWVVPTATAGREDFVALNGQNAIVKTSFRNNQTRRDSQRRSYWVFNLLAIQRNELVLANELDARFPKWVRYFARPNHTAAVFPADEKTRIWNLDQHDAMFWEALIPNP